VAGRQLVVQGGTGMNLLEISAIGLGCAVVAIVVIGALYGIFMAPLR
jgi:hypothetical protein